jgi:hypothetical protein
MTFTLNQDGLALQTVTTFTPAGAERSITIDNPVEGAEVAGSVQLSGSFTISPFENTLTYDVLDTNGVELLSGAITVTAPELGGPGTFETSVDISTIPSGTPVLIAVQDTSAADGSIIALDSVRVTVE